VAAEMFFGNSSGTRRVYRREKTKTPNIKRNVDADEKKRLFAMAGAFEEIPNPEFQNHRTPVPSDGLMVRRSNVAVNSRRAGLALGFGVWDLFQRKSFFQLLSGASRLRP